MGGVPIAGYGTGMHESDGRMRIHGPNERIQVSDRLMTRAYDLAILQAWGVHVQ